MSEQSFLRCGIAMADTVILGTPPHLRYPDNDALLLSALVQVRAAIGASQGGGPSHLRLKGLGFRV